MRRTVRATVVAATAAMVVALLPQWGSATMASPTITKAASGADAACTLPTSTVAQRATATASYTASWNNIAAVSDGVTIYSGGGQTQLWGTYSATSRPAQQWLQYEWSSEGTFSGVTLSFWHDTASATAGDGVAVPASWRIQAWKEGAWADVSLAGGLSYTRDAGAPNAVTFASPVTTSKLRAVLNATTDGKTYGAVGVSEFAVTGEAPENPAKSIAPLTSDAFNVGISQSTGGVYYLSNPSDKTCTNYVENPSQHPKFDIADSRWVGDIGVYANGVAHTTGLSSDIRKVTAADGAVNVSYPGGAANKNGINGFALNESYKLTGADKDSLDWSITIDNTSTSSLDVSDLTVPMLMNSWWNGGDQTSIYEQSVARHSYVAADGSYVYWQRPNGVGPYLVMVPKDGTSLEFRDKARTGEGPFGESDPSWEGLVEFAIHSEHLQKARAGKIGGYLPATSLTLDAGASKTYGFTFHWAKDYTDLRSVLYNAGVVDVVSLPGMVIPQDQQATLAVRAKDGIDSVTAESGKKVDVAAGGDKNGYKIYTLKFHDLGPGDVTVTYAGGRRSVLQYNSIKPIADLISTHASFLTTNQQAKTTRGYNGAFLQWDMSRQKLVTWDDYPGGGWKQWMAGGSDDLGLTPALYLAQKNLIQPVQSEVDSVDYYIQHFLLDYLQAKTSDGQRTWQVYRWFDGKDGTPSDQGVWRAYNYTHIANTYFTMYQLASAHPELTTDFTATQYPTMAYNTLDAMFNDIPQPTPIGDAAHDMGLMGESTYPDILAALKKEGMTTQATSLQTLLQTKFQKLSGEAYPFASEASIDTTGFETSYTLAKMFGSTALADKVQNASVASRGLQPLWYYYGSDNRHMGESWWNLGYETQLGAWQQQDYLETYGKAGNAAFDDQMRSTYGAYLGGWSNINAGQISSAAASIGAASWQYQSQLGAGEGTWSFMPMLNGWWAWSGEADLGFWGGLRTASVDVVNDGVVGLYAYGGDITLTDGTYTIVPKDGVQQRIHMFNEGGLDISLTGAQYAKARIAKDRDSFSLDLTGTPGSAPSLTATNVKDGLYAVTVNGTQTSQVQAASGRLQLNLSGAKKGDSVTVSKVPTDDGATAKPGAAVLSSDNGNDTGLKDGDYRVTMNMWWRQNAGQVKFYENGALVSSQKLTTSTPSAQNAHINVTGKKNGSYTYTAELINSKGTTTTSRLTVAVKDANPGTPVLSRTGTSGTGSYTVTANMWWGTNATSYTFYENGKVIGSGDLTATTPNAQVARVAVTGRDAGTYTYTVTFSNAQGSTTSSPLKVVVAG